MAAPAGMLASQTSFGADWRGHKTETEKQGWGPVSRLVVCSSADYCWRLAMCRNVHPMISE